MEGSTPINYIHSSNLFAAAALFLLVMTGCSRSGESARRGEHDHDGGEHRGESRGEHDRDGDEHRGAKGEESGNELALNQTYDNTRHGARLILAYDVDSNTFRGTVENTTDKSLDRVRVEVHLSSGKELGPTTPVDLKPHEKIDVALAATSRDFDKWSAHPEVGRGEHGHGQAGSEHDEGVTDLKLASAANSQSKNSD